jgi:hypothetical protein
MSRFHRIAARVALPVVLKEQMRNLADLEDLSENIDDMVDMFGRHFKAAVRIDTDVESQFELLRKAKNGLDAAKQTQKTLGIVLKEYPDDKTALRAMKDAMTMVKRFERHEKDARKVISTISKKQMPPSLVKYANSIARAMKAKLVNPRALRVVPWQQKAYRQGVLYQVVIILPTPGYHQADYRVTVEEGTDSKDGPQVKNQGHLTPKKVAETMADVLRGWMGLVGEESAIASREEIARKVALAVNDAMNRMRPMGMEQAEVGTGNANVRAAYRSDLPKEGAHDVGYDQYQDMVDEEIGRFKKVVEPLLRPYSKAVKDIKYYDGEKSWIYVDVGLK